MQSLLATLVVAIWVMFSLPAIQAQNEISRIEGKFLLSDDTEDVLANRELHNLMPGCKKLLSILTSRPTPFFPGQDYLYKWEVGLFEINHELMDEFAYASLSPSGQALMDLFVMEPITSAVSEHRSQSTTWPWREEDLDHIATEMDEELIAISTECISNVDLLVSHLNRLIGKRLDPLNENSKLIQTRNQLLELGYYLATSKSTKLDFAGLRYVSYLRENLMKQAELWRYQVIEDSQLRDLPVDYENVGESLKLLCYEPGHKMRLAELCLRTLERAIVSASAVNEPISHAVYSGAKELMFGLTGFHSEPVSLEQWTVHQDDRTFRIYEPRDVAFIGPSLREVLELIPRDQQDMSFYDAYRYVVGERTRIRWLNEMALRNPEDTAIQEELRLLNDQ